jgi:hypothetical protein
MGKWWWGSESRCETLIVCESVKINKVAEIEVMALLGRSHRGARLGCWASSARQGQASRRCSTCSAGSIGLRLDA